MNIEHLRTFRELVICGSIRKLAQINGMSIGKISRDIRLLEKNLGFILLERTNGSMEARLTYQGSILFNTLPHLLGLYDNTMRMMRSNPELYSGELSINTTSSLIEDWLVHMLPSFNSKYPDIKLNLIAQNALFTREMKKLIISISPKDDDVDNIVQVPLLDFHVGLWASKDYLDTHGRPKDLSDLDNHQILVFAKDMDNMTYSTINWFIDEAKFDPSKSICINSSNALIKAAHEGIGIISLSEEAIKACGYKLERVIPLINGPTITMCLTYPTYWSSNNNIIALEEFLIENFPKLERMHEEPYQKEFINSFRSRI